MENTLQSISEKLKVELTEHLNGCGMMFRLRIKGDDFSPQINSFLRANKEVPKKVYDVDRMIILLTMLNQSLPLSLTYDNLLFLINRIEINDQGILEMEPPKVKQALDRLIV